MVRPAKNNTSGGTFDKLLNFINGLFNDAPVIAKVNWGSIALIVVMYVFSIKMVFPQLMQLRFWGRDIVLFTLIIAGFYIILPKAHKECQAYCKKSLLLK